MQAVELEAMSHYVCSLCRIAVNAQEVQSHTVLKRLLILHTCGRMRTRHLECEPDTWKNVNQTPDHYSMAIKFGTGPSPVDHEAVTNPRL
jgi:hypothetical protein